MPGALKLGFAPFAMPSKGVLVAFCNSELKLGPATRKLLASAADQFRRPPQPTISPARPVRP